MTRRRSDGRGSRAGAMPVRWRSTVAWLWLLPSRRLRRDVGVLACWAAVLLITVLIAVAAPRTTLGVLDDTARESVADAGGDADIVVTAAVGELSRSDPVPVIRPAEIVDAVGAIDGLLPPALAHVTRHVTLEVVGGPTATQTVSGRPPLPQRVQLRTGLLTPSAADALVLDEGRLPRDAKDTGTVVEGVIARSAADATGIELGSEIGIGFAGDTDAVVEIVGIVSDTATDRPTDAAADQIPADFWSPTGDAVVTAATTVTVLTTPSGLLVSTRATAQPATATVRLQPDPDEYSAELLTEAAAEARALSLDANSLAAESSYEFSVSSDLDSVLDRYTDRARTVQALSVVFTAGLLGTAAFVLLIVGGILARRRAADSALERARGSSLAAVGLRALLEAMAAGIVAAVLGVGLAALIGGNASSNSALAIPVVAASVLTAAAVATLVVQAVGVVVLDEAGRRVSSNRRDRDAAIARRRALRITGEVLVLTFAVFATVALGARDLRSGAGADLFAAAAPVLIAAAAAIVVLRIHPWAARAVAALASHTRGPWGLLAAVQARVSPAALALMVLTLALALVSANLVIAASVRQGQLDASWARVGADVRVDAPLDADAADAVLGRPGVTAASVQAMKGTLSLDLGTTTTLATVIAVDDHYVDVIAALPVLPGVAGVGDAAGVAPFHELATAAAAEVGEESSDTTSDAGRSPVPIVVDAVLAQRLVSDDLDIEIGELTVPATVVGVTDADPSGYVSSPVLYADLATLQREAPDVVAADQLLVIGPGAEAAVSAVSGSAATPGRDLDPANVVSRSAWLAEQRQRADVRGVQLGLDLATGALVLLALAGFAASVVGGSRARSRSTALLRTIGMPARVRLWLALADTVPLVVAAVLGGALAGVVLLEATGAGLGLQALTNGVVAPELVLPATSVWAVPAMVVVLPVLGVAIDLAVQRRDRAVDVLRVGETI